MKKWITIDSTLHIETFSDSFSSTIKGTAYHFIFYDFSSHVCIEKTDLQCISSKKLTGLLGKAI